MVDQTLVVSALIFGAVVAVLVLVYNVVAPMLLGRAHHAMPVLDLVLLAAFVALMAIVLKMTGLWEKLMLHL